MDWYITLFGKWANIKNAKGESQECVDFFAPIREAIRVGEFNGVGVHIANEYSGTKSNVFGQVMKCMGKVSGAADYVFTRKDCAVWIEMKHGKGKQQKNQEAFQAWCESQDTPYHLCQSKEEAWEVLKEYGFLPEETYRQFQRQ